MQSLALIYGGGSLVLVFLALFFVQKAFAVWLKFGMWFIPLAALLFIFYPSPEAVNFPIPLADTVFQFLSGLYLGISAVLIASVAAKNK